MTDGQPAGREELSRALRQLRKAAGLTGAEAARRAEAAAGGRGWQSKLSRIENSRIVPSDDDVKTLADVYGATTAELDALLALLRAVQAKNRRLVLNRDPAALQQRLEKMEGAAAHAGTFQLGAVPGLLQTEDYIRAVCATASTPLTGQQAVDFVASRLKRQATAQASTGTHYTEIFTEGALATWQMLPPVGMQAQVDRIIECMDWPSMTVGIIPATRQVDVMPLHGFDLFDDTSALIGLWTMSAVFEEAQDVAPYVALFRHLEALAVYGDEARALLRRVRDTWT